MAEASARVLGRPDVIQTAALVGAAGRVCSHPSCRSQWRCAISGSSWCACPTASSLRSLAPNSARQRDRWFKPRSNPWDASRPDRPRGWYCWWEAAARTPPPIFHGRAWGSRWRHMPEAIARVLGRSNADQTAALARRCWSRPCSDHNAGADGDARSLAAPGAHDNRQLVAQLGSEPRTPRELAARTTLRSVGCRPA